MYSDKTAICSTRESNVKQVSEPDKRVETHFDY